MTGRCTTFSLYVVTKWRMASITFAAARARLGEESLNSKTGSINLSRFFSPQTFVRSHTQSDVVELAAVYSFLREYVVILRGDGAVSLGRMSGE
jgi:hypothetical protein